MNDLQIDCFHEFSLKDRHTIEPLLVASNPQLCDYNFANLYCWGEIYSIKWNLYKNRLLIYDGHDDYLTMPVGEPFALEEFVEMSDALQKQGKSGNYFLVALDVIERNRADFEHFFDLKIDENLGDYIYNLKKLYELKGSKLQKKKNLVSQFRRNNPDYRVERLERKFFDECLRLAEIWCRFSENCNDPGVLEENRALRRALQSYEDLGLDGLTMFAGDKIVAFSIFDRLNVNTADIHFEKTDMEIKGCSQAINWKTAEYLLNNYEFINREQDMGVEGLRQAKRSYCPEFLATSYSLIRKK
ncbi:MAG: phosphatidylglycerol lysyltransferase domain-containing protein [Candidatus Wallbacteria bacterium]|nr:phosphatidylglycerol lysyltransferase domain-containing protein [Candidatus Wallbacteria bacterium]